MKYFGTDGIRQKATKFTPEFITRIIKGLTDYAGNEIKVFLAGDTRESTEWILQDLRTALESFGVEYASAGVLPTPAINYCFYEMGFDFAIDVTASHNPASDNGIKIFERGKTHGQKLSEKGCKTIEKALDSTKKYPLASPTDREDLHTEALALYINHIINYLGNTDLSGLRIAIDCANGATSVVSKTIFKEFGAKVHLINADTSYGTKINHNCGSTHTNELKTTVIKYHLDFGIAFDGDGDRCIMIDSDGNTIDGDNILAILALYLKLDSIVITVMSNQGLLNWAKESRIKTEITPVGDSNVYSAMQAKKIKLGGEQSGHIILPNESTGDGILTGLMVSKAVAESKTPLDAIITKSPQIITNLRVSDKQKQDLADSKPIKTLLNYYSKKLDSINGRLLVRPSGTEPLIRITIWGDDGVTITKISEELKAKLGELL